MASTSPPSSDRPAVKWVLRLAGRRLPRSSSWPGRRRYVVKHTFANGTAGHPGGAGRPRRRPRAAADRAGRRSSRVAHQPVFGVGMSLLLVRYDFPGKRALSALIDVPLSVSPVVVGLALVLVYNGRFGWFGPTLEAHGFQVVFAMPGMIMATCFVALPLVIREVVPVLEEIGRRPGAGRPQPRRQRVADLPADHPARHQVGDRLRRRAQPRPFARRVRRGQGRRRQRRRARPRSPPSSSSRSTRTSSRRRRTRWRSCSPSRPCCASSSSPCCVPKERQEMSIEVRSVSKRFGDFVALDDVTVSLPTGQLTALLGPVRRRQVHAAADHRRPRLGRRGHHQHRGHGGDAPAARRSATSASCSSTTPSSST